MSEHTERKRRAFNEWLEDRDTVFYEGGLGVTAIISAWQVLSVDAGGKAVAPFLDSSLAILTFDKTLWACVLSVVGAIKIIALVHGLVHDNSLILRSRVSFVASLMWSVMAISIVESHQPRAVAATYVVRWFISVMIYMALQARAHARKRVSEFHSLQMVRPAVKDAAKAAREAKCGL